MNPESSLPKKDKPIAEAAAEADILRDYEKLRDKKKNSGNIFDDCQRD